VDVAAAAADRDVEDLPDDVVGAAALRRVFLADRVILGVLDQLEAVDRLDSALACSANTAA
jgi:hypothetical protein